MSIMDLHQLRVFVYVFKNKSFSRASEDLHLTQPTISDHIRLLETEFDCKLFDRLGRTIVPTREAKVLYNHAVEILEKATAIKESVGQFKKKVSGELLIGASTIPGTYLIPPLMAGFQQTYPAISFNLTIADSKEIVDKMLAHELLVGIVGSELPQLQLSYMPLIDDELIVVASPSLPISDAITLKDLMKIPMVLREVGSGTRRETEKILEHSGFTLKDIRIAGIFGATDAVKQAVKAGLGTAILSKLSVVDELKYQILREIRLKGTHMKRKFYLVTHKKRTLPLAYTKFLEHIKAAVKTSGT